MAGRTESAEQVPTCLKPTEYRLMLLYTNFEASLLTQFGRIWCCLVERFMDGVNVIMEVAQQPDYLSECPNAIAHVHCNQHRV